MRKKNVCRVEPIKCVFADEDYDTIYSLAYSLYGTGDYGQAKEIFQKKYWMGLGACWQLEKSYEEALKAWSMVALLDDTDPTPHFHATQCYFYMEEREEGLKALQAAKKRIGYASGDIEEKIKGLENGAS